MRLIKKCTNTINTIMINTINNKVFRTANVAYEYLHDQIIQHGVVFGDTKALFNVGFYITDPKNRKIINKERNWYEAYALAEWEWYLTGDPSIKALGDVYGKVPEIWKRMADPSGKVNSNYGYQWERNAQLDMVVEMLRHNPDTRQACISIYDGKEITDYAFDTPCTYAIQFTIVPRKA
jgi:thymidylate synthase